MNNVAIIDLGTNTCNLLIAEYNQQEYKILYQGKEIVKMGKGGINKHLILDPGIQRAVLAIKKHQSKIKEYRVEQVIAYATSAVRDASNRDSFCKTIQQETGISLNVISGEEEAGLIFNGVLLAFENNPGNSLILDIGGGSNEFILCRGKEVVWKHSFPLGVARIIDKFSPSDPITADEIVAIRNYFDQNLTLLWDAVSQKEIESLIGCSGAFDSLVDLIDQTIPGTKQRKKQLVTLDEFHTIYDMLIRSTMEDRMQMKGLELLRVEMILPAVILIDWVVKKLNVPKIIQTDYALREGALRKLLLFD